jgi:hypothetical protein
LNVDFHFTPFLSLANVIGNENSKVKSWDVIRKPAVQQFGGSGITIGGSVITHDSDKHFCVIEWGLEVLQRSTVCSVPVHM